MANLAPTDYGTPASKIEKLVTLEIDGHEVTVPAGTSIMRAAMEASVKIPKLCATDSLEPFGSCRLCLVEIEGRRGYPASCTTPAEAGMKVKTQSGKLAQVRRGVMELYISDHPLDCLTCSAMATASCRTWRAPWAFAKCAMAMDGKNHLKEGKDESNPYFTFDASKCIVCSRCVRACEETQGTFALTIDGRGFASFVSAGQDEGFLNSECVSCGACVQACPTATLMEKERHRQGTSRTLGHHDLRLLWRRLLLPRRDEGHGSRAHGAPQGRQGEPRPLVREGPLRLGLRHPQGPRHQAHDPREDHRSVARGVVGRSGQLCRIRIQAHPGEARPRLHRRHHLVALHQRRDLPRAEAGCAPRSATTTSIRAHAFAIRPRDSALGQTLGTSAGTQEFDSVDECDVMMIIGANPSAGAPRVRVAHEEALAPRREAHRHRPAHDRVRLGRALPRRLPPQAPARHQRRRDQRIGPYHRLGRPREDRLCVGALRHERVREVGSVHPAAAQLTRGDGSHHGRACRGDSRRGAPLCHWRQRRHLLRTGRDRAQPGLHDGDGHRQTSRCSPAT